MTDSLKKFEQWESYKNTVEVNKTGYPLESYEEWRQNNE